MKRVFGPVASRRLGYSLGIDLLPGKVCSLDCAYCQIGRTQQCTIERSRLVDPDAVLAELRDALAQGGRIDYITFSGSGEPTLHSDLGTLIAAIKEMTPVPVAVLTNGTLIDRHDVQQDLAQADLVVPSLDAVSADVFARVNRPHASLAPETMIEGLCSFRSRFAGKLWLEIMLVAGCNDTPEEIDLLRAAAARIAPDRVQLNTVTRPPADSGARPVTADVLDNARSRLGPRAQIISSFRSRHEQQRMVALEDAIISLVSRHPCVIAELARALGRDATQVQACCDLLVAQGRIHLVLHGGQQYYSAEV